MCGFQKSLDILLGVLDCRADLTVSQQPLVSPLPEGRARHPKYRKRFLICVTRLGTKPDLLFQGMYLSAKLFDCCSQFGELLLHGIHSSRELLLYLCLE